MYKSWLSAGVIIALLHIQITSGDLSIDQKIREGNRKRKLDVRLVDGISKLEGRVEIRYNDTWGTICDDRFNRKAAAVVCHMLGYRRLRAKPYKRAAYGEGKGPIWLDDLKCHGNETSLGDCKHLPWGIHNCGHKEDVGVKCQARKKAERNRMLTLELDMVVKEGERPKLFQRNKSNRNNAVKDQSKLWMKDVFYMLEDGIDIGTEVLIRNALDEWERYSCLHFSKDVLDKHYNKIVFTVNHGDKGCASTYVGMKQGPQEIHLANDCLHRDIILHEIGHALGFYHEHNRADRDQYIKVHYENIIKGYEHQFIKLHKDEYEDFGKPYDYKSIMHYGRHFFSRNESQNLVTMETVDPEFHDVIGKVKHPSFLDYKILNAMYECSAGCSFVRCTVGGFLGKDCQCYCEGNQDNEPITLCSKEKNCQNPSINEFLFEVLDRVNETVVYMTRDTYPDNTVFNIFSTNLNCSIVSELLCDSGTWLGGMPDCPVELGIKLIDGSDDEGIIELMLNEQWRGFICDDDWDDNDATVACRMIGFEFGKARGENLSKVNESLQILLDDVKCSGSESTLSECNHNGLGKHDCDHSEVAAIKCFPYKDTQQKDVLNNIDCGKIPLKGTKRKKREVRIVGGAEAVKGMYPWQVGIQRMRGRWIHWCGGTILSSHWILTAAHCFDDLTIKHDGRNEKMNYEDFRVLIGDHDRTKDDEQEQEFHIEYVVKHWQYSADRINPENDIALLKIDSDSGVVFNDYVQPACLPGENVSIEYGMKCEVSGWGKRTESGEIQNKLRSIKVPIIEDRKCEHFYKQYPIDTQRVFCAGDVNARLDTCQGDSGGPLVCDIKDRSTVFGITSWGLGCGRSNDPGVYTKVSAFVSWIKQQISLHDFVAVCRRDEFSCRNGGRCLPLESRCNSVIECADRSDELGCAALPTVSLEPENITIPMGTNGTLRCKVTGKPEPKITWLKSGAELALNHQVNGNVLRITQATMADRGIYVCRAENAAGLDQDWTVVEVERRMRPKIDLYPNTTQRVAVGGSALFQCRVMDGDPPPTIAWSRVGGTLMPADKVETMENGVIMFKQVTQAEQGGYICAAENEMGTTTATATLIVEGQPTITIQPSKTVYALIGQRVTLECTADGDPLPAVYWIEPVRPGRGDFPQEVDPDYLGEVTYGTAIIDIASVDRGDEGTYKCVASNTGGQTEDRVQLVVPPSVIVEQRDVYTEVNGIARLRCDASGSPIPQVRWEKEGDQLPTQHKIQDGVLTIYGVQEEDAGRYICTAATSSGSSEDYAVLHVTTDAEIVNRGENVETQVVNVGDRVSNECIVTGTPLPTITWSRDDGPLPKGVILGDGILIIPEAKIEDAGTYTCLAVNEAGSIKSKVVLYVRETDPPSCPSSDFHCESTGFLECILITTYVVMAMQIVLTAPTKKIA